MEKEQKNIQTICGVATVECKEDEQHWFVSCRFQNWNRQFAESYSKKRIKTRKGAVRKLINYACLILKSNN